MKTSKSKLSIAVISGKGQIRSSGCFLLVSLIIQLDMFLKSENYTSKKEEGQMGHFGKKYYFQNPLSSDSPWPSHMA